MQKQSIFTVLLIFLLSAALLPACNSTAKIEETTEATSDKAESDTDKEESDKNESKKESKEPETEADSNSKNNPYLGKWYLMVHDVDETVAVLDKTEQQDNYLEIKEDDKHVLMVDGEEFSCTCEINGNDIVLDTGSDTFSGSIYDQQITVYNSEELRTVYGKAEADASDSLVHINKYNKQLSGGWIPVSASNFDNEEIKEINGVPIEECFNLQFYDGYFVSIFFSTPGNMYLKGLFDMYWSPGSDIIHIDLRDEKFAVIANLEDDKIKISLSDGSNDYHFILKKEQ